MAEKIVLAYSGGLDTSVAIRWLKEDRGYDVVALTVDVGMDRSREELQSRAEAAGAVKYVWSEVQDEFVRHFVFPAVMAGAKYQGVYPLATALSRPLIAREMVAVARAEGATAVAHGCTGKGNDQVRLDVSVQALAPDLSIVAPLREWEMDRESEIEYAQEHKIPVTVTKKSPYSIDENLYGRSIETGPLEDPWTEPPDDVWQWTKSPQDAPDKPTYVEIGFEAGKPVSLDGKSVGPVELVSRLNKVAGENGVGRIDTIEDRLVGIKSREVYEAPAGVTLLAAHEAIESLTLGKEQRRFKARVAQEYADLVYNGLWFSAHHQDLQAYIESTQRHVTGTVRMKLHKGSAMAAGRKSPRSLYDFSLATYDKADQFDRTAAVGFISIWGLPVKVQAQAQLIEEEKRA
ncbi:MAG TPA: argininosuccinate synthase [Dehalococcoidia bacterium]|jgi:argininosuccinate synthase|nr:argininosuccinate synthase [Dehalococcoidia bacterium]